MAGMSSSLLRSALRRALLLSLAVPASLAAGCGGKVVVDTPGGSGGGTGGAGGSGGDNPGCALVSSTPVTTIGTCESTFDLVGPASACAPDVYGKVDEALCLAVCPPSSVQATAATCWANEVDAGTAQLTCAYYQPCGTGRRPPGLAEGAEVGGEGEGEGGGGEGEGAGGEGADAGAEGAGVVARFLGEVAHLEAASVLAFEGLARELEAHAAPARLVGAARRAAREEVEHAEVMARFATRAGARLRPVVVTSTPARSLEAIAADNAVEGCVRETFGAVIAMHQAERARSGEMRRALERIAREEAAHAELAWELAGWLRGRLDEAARGRVDEARRVAVEALAREVEREPEGEIVAELGWPTPCEARAAMEALRVSIWVAAA
jgi:hypothetical protein